MHIRSSIIAALAVALTLAVTAWAQQPQPTQDPQKAEQAKPTPTVGEVLEGKIKQAALHYYLGMVLGDQEEYLKGTRLPLQTVRSGKIVALDEAAAKTMLKTLAAKQAEKPLTKEERTQVIGNMIHSLDEADIRFIGANTATLVFLVRQDSASKAEFLCSLTLHRADPKSGEWKVIQETTDSEPVPADYVR
jgi:hypothetical protein